jgi:hypothetical protein
MANPVTSLFSGEMKYAVGSVKGLTETITRIDAAAAKEAQDRATAVSNLQTDVNTKNQVQIDALAAHKTNDFAPLKADFDLANASETTTGSIRNFAKIYGDAIKDAIINGAGGAWDTLKEIQDGVASGELTLGQAIIDSIASAKAELRGTVTGAMDTLGEIETTLNAFIQATTQNLATLRTDLQAFAVNAARLGGSKKAIEFPVVNSAGRIVLANAPKDGVLGINNCRIEAIDADGTITTAPVYLDTADATGKTFVVDVPSNLWNGRTTQAYYEYISAA